jgi:gluconate 2-dehydrogenase gamma chain
MRESTRNGPARRRFLKKAAVVACGIPFLPRFGSDVAWFASADAKTAADHAPFADPASSYRSLNAEQAAFTEAMVNVLCPADHLTPDGVTCGLAAFIDRELAGDFRAREAQFASVCEQDSTRSRVPPDGGREQLFKAGIAAANRACEQQFRTRFDRLTAPDAAGLLRDMRAGRVVDADVSLVSWLDDVVDPLLTEICFAGPIHDGYHNRVFWKVFG